MTRISSVLLADMRARREVGETVENIASRHGVTPAAVYQQFHRKLGGTPLPGPANDNNPSRVTRMVPHNGGCSTVSGRMPVSLVRIPSVDGMAVADERVAA